MAATLAVLIFALTENEELRAYILAPAIAAVVVVIMAVSQLISDHWPVIVIWSLLALGLALVVYWSRR